MGCPFVETHRRRSFNVIAFIDEKTSDVPAKNKVNRVKQCGNTSSQIRVSDSNMSDRTSTVELYTRKDMVTVGLYSENMGAIHRETIITT